MADLPINYGDSGKVARDKINDSFNELAATVEGYKPQIINGVWWIGTTNTGVKAEGDSIVMKVEDGYIWYKSESNSWTKIIAVADLKGSQGNPGADGNGIESVTSTKVGKTTTVTMNFDEGDPFSFEVQDGADGVGGDGDVKGPDSSTNGHMAVFDGATGKVIRDGGSVPTGFAPGNTGTTGQVLKKTNGGYEWDDESGGGGSGDVTGPSSATDGHLAVFDGATGRLIKDGGALPTKTSDLNNDSGYITSSDIPEDISEFNNDAGYLTSSTGVTSFNGSTGAVTYTAPVSSVNGGTGAVTVSEFSPSGTATTGYVVTKTASGYEWAAPSGGDVMVSSQTGNILTTGMKIWAGTESDYGNLGTYDSNTLYLTI